MFVIEGGKLLIRIIPKYRIPQTKRIKTTYEHKKDLEKRDIFVEPIGLYMGLEVPMLYKYPCGHIKEMRPQTMKQSNKGRCLECFPNIPPKTHQLTTDEFRMQMKNISPNIQICGKYTRSDEPIKVKCMICDFVWSPIAHTLKQGHGCPNCRYINSRLTKEDFDERVGYWRYDFDIVDDYTTLTSYYTCKCKTCGYEWMAEGVNLISGKSGCTNCFTNSKGEKLIRNILNETNIQYIPQKKFDDLKGMGNRPLMFDFYFPDDNLLIEYQGIQHARPIGRFGGKDYFNTLQEHDRRKREYAEKHGIKLLEIWYYDFDRIEEILKNNLNLETVETDIGA